MIRKSTPNDLDSIMKIWLEANLSAHKFIPASYWYHHYNAAKQGILQAEVYVYERENEVLGFVGLLDHYIAGLFVQKERQRANIGTELIDHLKAIKPFLSLNVYEKNQGAVLFYKKQGFAIESAQQDEFLKETEYLMTWRR
jgi:putative acetyltransferase